MCAVRGVAVHATPLVHCSPPVGIDFVFVDISWARCYLPPYFEYFIYSLFEYCLADTPHVDITFVTALFLIFVGKCLLHVPCPGFLSRYMYLRLYNNRLRASRVTNRIKNNIISQCSIGLMRLCGKGDQIELGASQYVH